MNKNGKHVKCVDAQCASTNPNFPVYMNWKSFQFLITNFTYNSY
jgi:hypothetical protein